MNAGLFDDLYDIITCTDIEDKCAATMALPRLFDRDTDRTGNQHTIANQPVARNILTPGLPPRLQMVAPRQLKRRGIQSQAGRNVLMHAIAHIEFNAINLALDAAFRFRDQPREFYGDWIGVAADEARHFSMIREYLIEQGCDYGDFPAHNGLWDMAVKTDHDALARMAMVPRVMEARGLDVTPQMIKKLQRAGDSRAVSILTVIYEEEIEHVRIGSKWFDRLCCDKGCDPGHTFLQMIGTYLHGDLKGPFNTEARLRAGFGEKEIEDLKAL
jgi:uncharacterized ferritin-like protein (DUF455 family)